MTKRRVVITGLGAVTPLGNSVAATWEAAKLGRSGVARITRFDASEMPSQIAAEVKGFDAGAYLDSKEIKKHDLFSQFAIAAAQEAWDDAALSQAGVPQSQMGCILGIGIGGLSTLERFHSAYLEGGVRKISPFMIPSMISNLGPGNIAIRFGLKGVNFTITSACTSATHALGEAYRMIRDGVQEIVMTGGSEAAVTPMGVGGFCALKALSTRNDEPERASRPFDRDRDGFVLGEGAAMLVLESYENAHRRGARMYAEIVGYGASCDAHHITAPCADGEGAVSCMKIALEDAGMSPQEITYVNAHGTSTSANDSTETLAIKQVFGAAASALMISSTKSMTGHLLGAAGAIEGIFCTLAVRDGIVPPTINLDNPSDGCDLDYVPHKARQVKISAAMSNSFGFGGTNASIIVSPVR